MTDSTSLAARLDRGETAVGVLSTIASPNVVEVLADAGAEFVWVDLEHGGHSPLDAEYLEHLSRAAGVADVELVVRLPESDPALVRKALDADVRNVLIPRVETAAEVRRCVEAAYFTYDGDVGDRGLAGVRANCWGGEMEGYVERADEEVRVGVMLENREAVANLDEMLAVPELGFAFVGPWDLSHSLGHPLDESHPVVEETVAEIEAACRDADVPIMGFVGDGEDAAEKVESGYRLLVAGSDVDAVRAQVGAWTEGVVRGLGQTRTE